MTPPRPRRSGARRSAAGSATSRPRALQSTGRSFYSIASAGHESNAAVALALRPTDPALLHYRSGAFYLARAAQVGRDGVPDILQGVTAAREEPIAGGRHKVFGNHALAVIPQTSTIASHLPRAVGVAFAIERARKLGVESAWPADAVVVCTLRRRLRQPRGRAGRAEQRCAPRAPGAAAAAPLRLRGQPARDQRPLARGLGGVGAPRPSGAPLRGRVRRRPRSRPRDGRGPRRPHPRGAPARRPPPAHGPLPQPRRRRRRDGVQDAAGDPRRLGRRPAARDRALAGGRRHEDGGGAGGGLPGRARARARGRPRRGAPAPARVGRGRHAAPRAADGAAGRHRGRRRARR